MYQVGPIGFLLVMAAIAPSSCRMDRRAGPGPRAGHAPAPFRDARLPVVLLVAGDAFYGSHGVILWFIGGQVLAYDYRRRPV